MLHSRHSYTTLILALAMAAATVAAEPQEPSEKASQLIEAKQFQEAIDLLDKAIAEATDPKSPIRLGDEVAPLYHNRARAHEALKLYSKALRDYKAACTQDRNRYYLNQASWFAATCVDASGRDGKFAIQSATEAVRLASEALKRSDGLIPNAFALLDLSACKDTLAAAYAETGAFMEAVREQREALDLIAQNRTDLVYGLALGDSELGDVLATLGGGGAAEILEFRATMRAGQVTFQDLEREAPRRLKMYRERRPYRGS